MLHPGERRQQAVRHPRPPQVAQGPAAGHGDRGLGLPGAEGQGGHPGAGALRRPGLRHAQRAPGHGAPPPQPGAGPADRDPRGHGRRRPRAVPLGHAGPARGGLRRLGHHPDRVRQLLRLLHRARRPWRGDLPPLRPPGRRGPGPGRHRRHRGHAARPERQQLRPRPHPRRPSGRRGRPGPPPLQRPAAGRRCRRRHPPGPLHQPAPEGPAAGDHRRHGRDAGGVRAPAPAGAVRQRPGPRRNAPRLHRRALPGEAGGGPGGDARPGRHHGPHRRLPRRD